MKELESLTVYAARQPHGKAIEEVKELERAKEEMQIVTKQAVLLSE